jgi:pyruvate-formate lyase-activating enzyme
MIEVKEKVTTLPVMEHFYTLQGEGFHQGKAAYFIRLGGCDVGCVWCDVKDSWDSGKHPLRSIDFLISEAKKNSCEIFVISQNRIQKPHRNVRKFSLFRLLGLDHTLSKKIQRTFT